MSTLKRVLTLLTGSLSFPPPPATNSDTKKFGVNMQWALIRAKNNALTAELHPGVAIAEARAEELRNKIGSQ